MKIMLACAFGMSTSILVKRMQDAAKNEGKDYKIWAVDVDSIEDESGYDVILVGPQVKNRIIEIKGIIENDDIPVEAIENSIYGKCDGAAVLQFAENLVKGE